LPACPLALFANTTERNMKTNLKLYLQTIKEQKSGGNLCNSKTDRLL